MKIMAAPKGNRFWEVRAKHGRDLLFGDHLLLEAAARSYFEWTEDNPLIEVDYRQGKRVRLPKMRAMTMRGLCVFLGCSVRYFGDFKLRQEEGKHEDYLAVIEWIEEVIYTQKFTGAAAGMLNANLISRDLGLADRSELTGKNGEPLQAAPTVVVNMPEGININLPSNVDGEL